MLRPPSFLVVRTLNYLTAQTGWAEERLQPFSGKSITLNIFPWTYQLKINSAGLWKKAPSEIIPDAVFTFAPFAAPLAGLRFRQGEKQVQDSIQDNIQVTGDMQFAKELAYIFQNLRWDYEEDLSKIFGDVIAHRIANIIRHTAAWAKEASENMTENIRDYWVQEKSIVMSAPMVNQFNRDVDTLRDDVEHLERRLQKLAK